MRVSVRENIELYGLPDEKQFVEILVSEFGAAKHPGQVDAYMLEGLPFYACRLTGDELSVLSLSNTSLPDSSIDARVDRAGLSRRIFPFAGRKSEI